MTRLISALIALAFAPVAAHAADLGGYGDEASLFRKDASGLAEDAERDAGVQRAKSSVDISEEYAVGGSGRTNIDSYLGDFENPYAAPENTYEGSRSEFRDEDGKRTNSDFFQ